MEVELREKKCHYSSEMKSNDDEIFARLSKVSLYCDVPSIDAHSDDDDDDNEGSE
jgi:hypothetical protein